MFLLHLKFVGMDIIYHTTEGVDLVPGEHTRIQGKVELTDAKIVQKDIRLRKEAITTLIADVSVTNITIY